MSRKWDAVRGDGSEPVDAFGIEPPPGSHFDQEVRAGSGRKGRQEETFLMRSV